MINCHNLLSFLVACWWSRIIYTLQIVVRIVIIVGFPQYIYHVLTIVNIVTGVVVDDSERLHARFGGTIVPV